MGLWEWVHGGKRGCDSMGGVAHVRQEGWRSVREIKRDRGRAREK